MYATAAPKTVQVMLQVTKSNLEKYICLLLVPFNMTHFNDMSV